MHGNSKNLMLIAFLIIQSRRIRWAGLVARIAKRTVYRLLVRKPRERRPRCRWVDTIRMVLVEIGWSGVDGLVWIRIGTSGKIL
jgi:hypothetical protein